MDLKVRFTISLPFERFPELRKLIEARSTWHRIDSTWAYADLNWRPKCWDGAFRVLAIRRKTPTPRKGPLQLDLFQPRDLAISSEKNAPSILVSISRTPTIARTMSMFASMNARASRES